MVYIKQVNITNYKCFKHFSLELTNGVNIIVGNNEAGKSTIIEAIHLALTGLLNGKYLKNELSTYIFNKEIETEYLESLKTTPNKLPCIIIEIFFCTDDFPNLEGDNNSQKQKNCGIIFKIEFDEEYQSEYDTLLQQNITTIPIEFYKITVSSFAREGITTKSIPIKSVLIDSSSNRFQNGSDIYISKIIKDDLTEENIINLYQDYRNLKESFKNSSSIKAINQSIQDKNILSSKKVKICVDLSNKNSWDNILMTYLDDYPFHHIGKGEQCLIKTYLALSHKKSVSSNLVLIEEPENHLSHSTLNKFIDAIQEKCKDKQIIITTHSSFIANKLGLENLILLSNNKTTKLSELDKETYDYFKKLSGYQTLRMILCKKAILVEGPSDELIIQRAFKDKYQLLPIQREIDVISVAGLAFKRFLEISKILNHKTAVLTDNDKDYEKNITKKYQDYKDIECIKIFADDRNNLHTLEPQIVNANLDTIDNFCKILEIDSNKYKTEEEISEHMKGKANKTEYALKIFNCEHSIIYPNYINRLIDWCNDEQ